MSILTLQTSCLPTDKSSDLIAITIDRTYCWFLLLASIIPSPVIFNYEDKFSLCLQYSWVCTTIYPIIINIVASMQHKTLPFSQNSGFIIHCLNSSFCPHNVSTLSLLIPLFIYFFTDYIFHCYIYIYIIYISVFSFSLY